eukprot:COSAG05_NODE_749_length_7548_cov_9.496442_2_plen_704_part_00
MELLNSSTFVTSDTLHAFVVCYSAELYLPNLPVDYCAVTSPDWGGPDNCQVVYDFGKASNVATKNLDKVISSRLQDHPEVWLLLDRFRFPESAVMRLLGEHPSVAGSPHATNSEAACGWLQKNPEVWSGWLQAAQIESVRVEQERIEASQRKTNVTIGALFALESETEQTELATMEIAVNQINQNLAILPMHRLKIVVVDSSTLRYLNRDKTGSAASVYQNVLEAETLVRQLKQAGAVAVVGAGLSSDVLAIHTPMHAADIPLLSHSATKSSLSNISRYPGFARMCTPDNIETQALGALVEALSVQLDGDAGRRQKIGIVACQDAFCSGALIDMQQHLANLDPPIQVSWVLDEQPVQFDETSAAALIDNINAKLTAGCDENSGKDTAVVILLIHGAAALQLLAADGVSSIQTEWIASYSAATLLFNRLEIASQAAHVLTVGPRANPDHPLSSTLSSDSSSWALNVFDGSYAVAHALDALYQSGSALDNGTAFLRHLEQSVNFNGPSGAVQFNADLDRISGYELIDLGGAASTVTFGQWTPDGLSLFGSWRLNSRRTPCAGVAEAMRAQNERKRQEEQEEEARQQKLIWGIVGGILAAILLAAALWFRQKKRAYLPQKIKEARENFLRIAGCIDFKWSSFEQVPEAGLVSAASGLQRSEVSNDQLDVRSGKSHTLQHQKSIGTRASHRGDCTDNTSQHDTEFHE